MLGLPRGRSCCRRSLLLLLPALSEEDEEAPLIEAHCSHARVLRFPVFCPPYMYSHTLHCSISQNTVLAVQWIRCGGWVDEVELQFGASVVAVQSARYYFNVSRHCSSAFSFSLFQLPSFFYPFSAHNVSANGSRATRTTCA